MDEIVVVGYGSSKAAPIEKIYNEVENMPKYPGGQTALLKYIGTNIKYPAEAQKNNQQGKVIVQYTIDKTGAVKDICIMRGLSPELNKEAIHVVSSMPNWIPGTQNGEPVSVRYTLPITFALQ